MIYMQQQYQPESFIVDLHWQTFVYNEQIHNKQIVPVEVEL